MIDLMSISLRDPVHTPSQFINISLYCSLEGLDSAFGIDILLVATHPRKYVIPSDFTEVFVSI